MLLQAFYYIRRTEYRTGETDSSPEVLKKGKRDAARVQNKQKNEGQLESGRVTWQSQNRKLFMSGRGWAGEKAPQGIWIHPLFTVVQWNALLCLLYRRYQIPLVNLYPRPPLSSHILYQQSSQQRRLYKTLQVDCDTHELLWLKTISCDAMQPFCVCLNKMEEQIRETKLDANGRKTDESG